MAEGARIAYLGHATVLLEIDGVRLLTDPVLGDRLGPLRRHGPTPGAASVEAIDVVLVSHAHPDHFDRSSLRSLAGCVLVVPEGMGRGAARLGHEVRELPSGASISFGDVRVTAVPARHWRWPPLPRARTIGYLVEGSTAVYFAGDTAFYPAMDRLAGRVDVALLPVGRWGPHPGPDRLGPADAARAARVVGAGVAIPIHWGTLYPPGLHRFWPRPLREPAALFAAELEQDTGIDVRILEPGQSTEIASRRPPKA